MSWEWQHDNPVTYENNNDRYYSSTPQPLDKVLGLGHDDPEGNTNMSGDGRGIASGSGSGSGRQTPLQQQTTPGHAPALGFYPNPAHTLPTHITEQYFSPGYSINPNTLQSQSQGQGQGYRQSPLTYPFDNPYQTPQQNGNGNGIGHQYAGQGLDFGIGAAMNMGMGMGMGMEYSQFPDYSVPPPRSSHSQSISQPQSHSNSFESIHNLQQQLNYNYQDPGGGSGSGNGQITPETDNPSTDAFIQYMSNPSSYAYPAPGPDSSHANTSANAAQGTISPSQLGQQVLNKQFSSLFMSRGSSSSASSTEGGHDWSTPALVDELNPSSLSNLAYPHTHMSHFPAFAPSPTTMNPVNDLAHDGISQDTMNAIRGYMTCANRLGYGERKIVISTPKVGQKSYGNEKRFLCPHPQAALYGTSWWTPQGDSPTSPIVPPRINISLSGEDAIKDSTINWATVYGKTLPEIQDQVVQKLELPFLGNVAGRFLHISDHDGKRSSFTALVRIRAPPANPPSGTRREGWQDKYLGTEASEIIGTFESKEIKIISKPSKKKTNSKSTELVITHGSTIAMYTRTKSQTASTRYLNIESDLTNIRGSDGHYIPNARGSTSTLGQQTPFHGLISSGTVWESFIIWLADPSKPAGLSGSNPLQPDWPSQPMNAMITSNSPAIRYNALVVLQSVTSGKCTPIMIIRRIDQDSDAVGQDGTVVDHSLGYAPEGEMLGDMVAQVQKVGMELYDPILSRQQVHNRHNGDSRWMACDHEHILDRYVQSERKWRPIPIPYRGGKSHSTPTTPNRGFHILPMTPHTSSTNLPSTPSSPVSLSSGSSFDYFGPGSRKSSSTHLISPISSIGEPLPGSTGTDGGPLRRPRTGSTGRMGPLGRPAHKKRQSQDSHSHSASASSSFDHLPNALGILEQRQSWSLSIGDVAVWTIVGTEQTSYTFYVPPTISVSDNPIAPFPQVTKYLPPGSDKLDKRTEVGFTPLTDIPLVHLYGKGFSKLADGPKYDVYYGDQKARHVEARCEECLAVSEPIPGTPLPAPITLVRRDGRCVIPTGIYYDHPPFQPQSQPQPAQQPQTHNRPQQR